MKQQRHLDEKDLKLVSLLEENAWITYAEAGEHVHLSTSAVQRRIERLRADGIITGAKATVDKTKLGKGLRVYQILELNNDSKNELDKLVSKLTNFEEVVKLAFVTGRFDLILTLDCENTESFTDFGMSQINPDKNIKHCWTLMQLKKLI